MNDKPLLESVEAFIIIPPPIVPGISIISSYPDNDNKHNFLARVLIKIPPPKITLYFSLSFYSTFQSEKLSS